jgi:hypothetical protein
LFVALSEGDGPKFKRILAAYLATGGMRENARVMGLTERTLFRWTSPSGNPTFEQMLKLFAHLTREGQGLCEDYNPTPPKLITRIEEAGVSLSARAGFRHDEPE